MACFAGTEFKHRLGGAKEWAKLSGHLFLGGASFKGARLQSAP
jgi:hypothetical protein